MNKNLILACVAIVALLVSVTGCSPEMSTDDGISRSLILYEHNVERIKASQNINAEIKLLKHSPELEKKAQAWAENMARRNRMYHSSMKDVREGTSFNLVGENVAWGYGEIDEVMYGWMHSRGHRANILNDKYTHAGFGYAKLDGRPYWCAQFGQK